MDTIAECCADAVAFSYRSIDRLVLNAYIPTLQTPAAVAVFFRDVQRKPILAGRVFKELTDRFVTQVMQFAKQRRIPVLRPQGRTRPGEVAQKALKAAERANRWGIVAIVVHQESPRGFASYHAGGRATNYRVKEDRRLVNHYHFYFRDRAYGDGFVRISSYPPFQTRIWMNAHGYLAAQLRRGRIAFRTFSNADLRAVLVETLGAPANQVSPGHIGYQLGKLRGKGLVRKVKGRNLYTLTDLGYRVAIYFTKLHQRLLAPVLTTFNAAFTTTPDASPHPVDRALQGLNAKLDALAQLCQLEIAA